MKWPSPYVALNRLNIEHCLHKSTHILSSKRLMKGRTIGENNFWNHSHQIATCAMGRPQTDNWSGVGCQRGAQLLVSLIDWHTRLPLMAGMHANQ
eukprot:scaffold321701_cov17-Prasinocladus_malaysianus.AAC.1